MMIELMVIYLLAGVVGGVAGAVVSGCPVWKGRLVAFAGLAVSALAAYFLDENASGIVQFLPFLVFVVVAGLVGNALGLVRRQMLGVNLLALIASGGAAWFYLAH